jgi:hypothetical protein
VAINLLNPKTALFYFASAAVRGPAAGTSPRRRVLGALFVVWLHHRQPLLLVAPGGRLRAAVTIRRDSATSPAGLCAGLGITTA